MVVDKAEVTDLQTWTDSAPNKPHCRKYPISFGEKEVSEVDSVAIAQEMVLTKGAALDPGEINSSQ